MQIDSTKTKQAGRGRRVLFVLCASLMLIIGGFALVELTENDEAAAQWNAWGNSEPQG